VLPKRQLFEEDAEQASATVAIGVGGREPGADMVRAIQNLVSGAVPNMKVDRSPSSTSTARPCPGGDAGMAGKLATDRKIRGRAAHRQAGEGPGRGRRRPGRAQVKVTAELDLNRVTVQEERYDPDGQVVRSESTSARTPAEKADGSSGVTAAGQHPGRARPPTASRIRSARPRAPTSVTNYEISKSVRTEVIEPGQVKKLSVAVAVDGATAPARTASPAPTPRARPRRCSRSSSWCAPPSASTSSAATRSAWSTSASPRGRRSGGDHRGQPADGLRQERHHARRRAGHAGLVVAILMMLFIVRPLLKSATGGGAGGAGGQAAS
jgi:flagellar M-ring protein FliF